jgi:glycosyltransferase involved in cell wall biosynthesis
MIVKDEEQRLGRCLDSVRPLSAELIVVDTGSTDRSRDLARQYGATVAEFEFQTADFAAARNYALARAEGRWILALDADETLDAGSVASLQKLVSGEENAGYYFQRRNRHADGDPTTDYPVRLYPNNAAYRYRGRVHETIDESITAGGGRLLRSGIWIDHDFATDPVARRRRNLCYIEILKEEIAADSSNTGRLNFLAAEYHQMGMFEEAAEVAERIVRLRPRDAEAHLHAGVYHLLSGTDRRKARTDFERALQLRPGDQEAQAFLEFLSQMEGGAGVETGLSP